MKIKQEHYAHIVSAIRETVQRIGKDKINAHITSLAGIPHDLDKRIRWDLARAANLIPYMCGTLYSYLDDSHIDTALRHAIKEIDLPSMLA